MQDPDEKADCAQAACFAHTLPAGLHPVPMAEGSRRERAKGSEVEESLQPERFLTASAALEWILQASIEAESKSVIGAPHERSESRTNQRNGHRPNVQVSHFKEGRMSESWIVNVDQQATDEFFNA